MSGRDLPEPTLATLSRERFWDPGWIYELRAAPAADPRDELGQGALQRRQDPRPTHLEGPRPLHTPPGHCRRRLVRPGLPHGVGGLVAKRADSRYTTGVHWTRPQLVAEVAFTEWTGAGQLRHPRYLGLRDDKEAKDVVRE